MEKNAKELREVASSYKNRIGEWRLVFGEPPRVPLAVGVSKGPGSSFRVYEVTGCGARYVWHHKSEVAALEFLIKKLKRVARGSKEKEEARHEKVPDSGNKSDGRSRYHSGGRHGVC